MTDQQTEHSPGAENESTQSSNSWSTKLPVFVLLVLTPLIAELFWGSLPVQVAYALPLLVPMYGCGTILIRELVTRANRGWPSILILGVAYGIVEEGVGLQSLFSPTMYRVADWGARVFGVNWAYTEMILVYHMVFSVAVPILVVDLLFPEHRNRPYLQIRGQVITAICFVLGVGLVRITVVPTEDPGYVAPIGHLIAAAVTVLGACIIALTNVPPNIYQRTTTQPSMAPPSPWVVGSVAGISIFLALRLPVPLLGAVNKGPTFGPGLPVYVLISASLVAVAALLVVLRRWSTRPDWNDQHLVALAGGLLVAHTAAGASIFGPTNKVELVALGVFAIIQIVFVFLLYQRI